MDPNQRRNIADQEAAYNSMFAAKQAAEIPKPMSVGSEGLTGFFLTPAAEKTKTQAQNSSQKLNHKVALSSLWEKVKKKPLIFLSYVMKFCQLQIF